MPENNVFGGNLIVVKYYKYYVSHQYHIKTLKIPLIDRQNGPTNVYGLTENAYQLSVKSPLKTTYPLCPFIVPAYLPVYMIPDRSRDQMLFSATEDTFEEKSYGGPDMPPVLTKFLSSLKGELSLIIQSIIYTEYSIY